MITVTTCSTPDEAHLVRLRLEAAGVPAFIADENTVQTYWLYANAIGGVRVQVHEDDLEEAVQILSDPVDYGLTDDDIATGEILDDTPESVEPPPSDRPASGEFNPTQLPCPKCASTEIAPDQLPRSVFFLSILLFGFPLLFLRRRMRCEECGHSWKCSY